MKAIDHVPFREYCKMPGVNISSLLYMLMSPKHYLHFKNNPRKDTPDLRIGRAVHTLTIEPNQLLREYVISPWPNFRTEIAQDWKAFQEESGLSVLTEAEYALAEKMAKSVQSDSLGMSYLTGGRHECTLTWEDNRTGISCKARLDYVSHAVTDLKSTRFITPNEFSRDAAKYHYGIRLAWYKDALQKVTGEDLPAVLLAVEKTAPHDVVPYELTEESIEQSRTTYERLMDDLRICMDNNEWPGVAKKGKIPLSIPVWTPASELPPITFDGEQLY